MENVVFIVTGKNTQLVIRIPKELKAKFETKCCQKEEIPSEITRNLIRDYVLGTPTLREVFLDTQQRLDFILSIVQGLREADKQLRLEP